MTRADERVLESALARLDRLSHRIVWLNPHAGTGTAPPWALAVAAPYIDAERSARDLAGLEEFARTLAALG